jgi:hypothetical protein
LLLLASFCSLARRILEKAAAWGYFWVRMSFKAYWSNAFIDRNFIGQTQANRA